MLLRRLSDALEDHGVGHTFCKSTPPGCPSSLEIFADTRFLPARTLTDHGKMDRNQRDKALSTLANEDECSVMLVSIKAGGLGEITTALSSFNSSL